MHFHSWNIVGSSSWNSTFSFWSGSCLRHVHKLSFRCILIILLRPLSVQALLKNGRFNKDGQKNKLEYINKPERNTCKDYPFHKYWLYLDLIRNTMLHSGGNLKSILVLIGTVFVIIWEMFHGMIPLNSVLLLLLVNFVSAFRLKLMYVSLIASIRSSLTDLAVWTFSKLPILFSSTIPPLFSGPEGSSSASHLINFLLKSFLKL